MNHISRHRSGLIKGEILLARIYPLFSGSSGNCYYISCRESGILIDAGRSAKQIETALHDNSISPASIEAIFVTHEHNDHIAGLRTFASRHKIKVYSSHATLVELETMGIVNGKYPCDIIEDSPVELDNMRIKAFKTLHDCVDSQGYVIETADGNKISIATDLGVITDTVANAVLGSNAAIIESNHDVQMLLNGPYPYYLKKRILSDKGHLSNNDCSYFLPELINSGTTRFILAHLSRENNMPELAYQSAVCELDKHLAKPDEDYKLYIAPVAANGMSITI